MEREARALNKAFMTLQTKGRPYIILKWAQSEDGFIDRLRTDVSEPVTVLSSPETSRLVHKLRSEVAAIMVGTRTALLDNPSLNVRHWSGNSPVRVVLDRRLVVPDSYRLLDNSSRTLIFTEREREDRENVEYIRIDFDGPVIRQVLEQLAARKLDSLLVEGGTRLIDSFVEADLWDEARVETAPVRLYQGVRGPTLGKEAVRGIAGRSVVSFKNHNYEF
ncbi:MAG: RibD family protein, partial [Parabacteroides sp.]|nr:RibD family protein [Parabacteroides sp.]